MLYLQEEIQQFITLWTPAEQEVLNSILDHIIALPDRQGKEGLGLQKPLPHADAGQEVKTIGTSPLCGEKSQSVGVQTDSNLLMTGLSESLPSLACTGMDAQTQEGQGFDKHVEETFGMGSPLLGSLHSGHIPLDVPLGWLFY